MACQLWEKCRALHSSPNEPTELVTCVSDKRETVEPQNTTNGTDKGSRWLTTFDEWRCESFFKNRRQLREYLIHDLVGNAFQLLAAACAEIEAREAGRSG